jgi:hypothetical protein
MIRDFLPRDKGKILPLVGKYCKEQNEKNENSLIAFDNVLKKALVYRQ